jgi:D-alanyl-D-alanine carboxypeptidase/D-alanyl-D-alanine-endopeptidase (penicillin-binding protein 4)
VGRIAVLASVGVGLIVCASAPAAGLPPQLRAVVESPAYRFGRFGLYAADVGTARPYLSLRPDARFLTASTAKIFATATALGELGPGYRFRTPVLRTGSLRGGTLRGELVLRASGDLTMGGRLRRDGTVAFTTFDHTDADAVPGLAQLTPENPLAGLDRLARQVRRSGIARVRGDVIVDPRLWRTPTLDGVPVSPIIVNDNLVDVVAAPTQPGRPARVRWRPHTARYRIVSSARTVGPAGPLALSVRSGGPGVIAVSGTIPAGRAPVVETYQAPPTAFARTLFIEALRRAGVAVSARALGPNPAERLPSRAAVARLPRVALLTSPPLIQEIRLILKVSHNLGANTMPLLLAVRHGQRTLRQGVRVELTAVRAAGVRPDEVRLVDGQGLAGDQTTPAAIVRFLGNIARTEPWAAMFRRALPILGVNGDLAHAVPRSNPARGRVFGKTGTLVSGTPSRVLLRVKAQAGYLRTPHGLVAYGIYLSDLPITRAPAELVAVEGLLGRMSAAIWARTNSGARGTS